MKTNLIVIDGKTYNSVSEMPPDVREKYEQAMDSMKDRDKTGFPEELERIDLLKDRDGNGIPDIFEGTSSTNISTSSTRFVVNGREYNRLDDLPPDARARYEKAMRNLDKNLNGIPDFAEDMLEKIQPLQSQSVRSAPSLRPSKPMNTSSTISPDTSNGWMLVLLGGLLVLVCTMGVLGIGYFFLR